MNRAFLFFGCVLILASCDLSSDPEPVPESVELRSLTPEEGAVGEELEVEVQVLDGEGEPFSRADLEWTVIRGAGEITPSETSTDSGGLASAVWQLGDESASQELEAAAGEATVTIQADAFGDEVTALSWSDEPPASTEAGREVPLGRLRAEDRFGQGYRDSIHVTVNLRGDTVSREGPGSDLDLGKASAPEQAGVASIQVEYEDLSLDEDLEVGPASPANIKLDADIIYAEAGARVTDLPDFWIEDAYGNLVAEELVEVEILEGGGSYDGTPSPTDEEGRSSLGSWTFGDEPGKQSLLLEAGEATGTLYGEAVEPTPVDSIEIVEGQDQIGRFGERAEVLAVRLLDQGGDPIKGAPVEWSVTSGGGDLEGEKTLWTDEDGFARHGGWVFGDPRDDEASRPQMLEVMAGDISRAFEAEAREEPRLDSLAILSGDAQRGVGGEKLAEALVVEVRDQFGDPLANFPLEWTPSSGALEGYDDVTDDQGRARARWRLGEGAEAQTLEVSAEEKSAAFQAERVQVATIEVLGGQDQSEFAGEELSDPVEVSIHDEDESPVRTAIEFRAEHGEADPDRVTADDEGRGKTQWTLGSEIGDQTLKVEAGEASETLAAEALEPPEPDELEAVSGDGQYGPPGEPLDDRLEIRVYDQYGDDLEGADVTWEATSGSLSSEHTVTGDDGTASVEWSPGSSAGTQEATAQVEGLEGVHFESERVGHEILGGYPVQVVQDLDQSIAMVEGRDALIRLFPRSYVEASPPEAKVELLSGGEVYETLSAESPVDPVRDGDGVDQGEGRAYRAELAAEDLRSGMRVRARLEGEPGGYWPSEEGLAVDTETVPDIPLHFVPVHIEELDRTGDVDEGNKGEYLTDLYRKYPAPDVQASVEPTYTYTGDPPNSDGDNWSEILSEVRQVREDANSEGIWYGLLNVDYSGGVAGIAYIGHPVGIGRDSGAAEWVLAHEVGHNLRRYHAPCNNAPNPDSNFPHTGGLIGVYGYDQVNDAIVPPDEGDVMGYCLGFVSDYTYSALKSELQSRYGAGVARDLGDPTDVIRVWGVVAPGEGELRIRPPYLAEGPERTGGEDAVEIRFLDSQGEVVHETTGEAHEVAHGDDRHFSGSIPLDAFDSPGVTAVEVVDPTTGLSARRSLAVGADPGDPSLEGDEVQFSGTVDLIVVRDPETEQIVRMEEGPAIQGEGVGIVEAFSGLERVARFEVDFEQDLRE